MTDETKQPQAQRVLCNKCGFYGVPDNAIGQHRRPVTFEPCNYLAAFSSAPQGRRIDVTGWVSDVLDIAWGLPWPDGRSDEVVAVQGVLERFAAAFSEAPTVETEKCPHGMPESYPDCCWPAPSPEPRLTQEEVEEYLRDAQTIVAAPRAHFPPTTRTMAQLALQLAAEGERR